MRVPGKKLIEYKSRKYFVNDKNSKTISMPMNQNGFKVVNNKRCYLTPGCRKKRACKRKNNLNGKPIETVQKKSNFNTDKRICSSKLTGRRACFSVRKNSKNCAGSSIKNSVRRRRLKRSKKNIVQDEVSRLQRRARYLLIKMKLEQNLIDAYSGDGWKGQSREKIKPEKELQRAERQILECKRGIRDLIHQLDLLGSEGRIEDSVMHPDGSVFHEHIFCAKCKSREAFHDNDIILCDGNCNCGFHQKCLEPQLEKIPPGDQGWLCKVCNCKMEILEIINAHLGTCFTVSSCWEDIFKEAIVGPVAEGACPNLVEDWPSDDSEDEDYCPEINKAGFDQSFSDDACNSIDSVVSSDASLNFTTCLGSSDSGDDMTNYRRQRRDVDYKKLYYEMFGKDSNEGAEQSEDEDWGPYRKKKKLHQNFDKNELPSMTVKENISKQFGISVEKAEASKQSDHRSDVSIVNGGNARISEAAVSLDSSCLLPLSSIFHLPRHKKRIHGRENLTSAAFSVKKQKGAATTVRSRGIQMRSHLKNAVSLKKHTITSDGDLISKKTTAFAAEEKQLHFNKMQMIWTLERRLHQLKQRLLVCQNDNEVQVKNISGEVAVIYVPVAEVKEKAS